MQKNSAEIIDELSGILEGLSLSNINPAELTADELRSDEIYLLLDETDDEIEKVKFQNAMLNRAKELKIYPEVRALIKAWKEESKRNERNNKYTLSLINSKIPLKLDSKGEPMQTIENFLTVLNQDKKFQNLRFNELSYSPEKFIDGKTVKWTDADDAETRNYIEKEYGLYNVQKLDDALRIKFFENKYHPIKQIVESIKWDGVERIPTMLIKHLKCEDTPYTREVSRLIFAGGINRLYNPGCKFDDVPILIGTRQGEGKSTFVRWLALKDEFFREVNEIEGQRGIESIEGAWICEFSELLALTKTKEVEAIKSYTSKQSDVYRKPYDKRISEYKRQCIFIGTTNRTQFLTDKVNRRFYPVRVNQDGYKLFSMEKEIKNDILMAWVEAKVKYDKGEMLPYADIKLLDEIRRKQAEAVEDDYRVGLIQEYLSDKNETCIIELWQKALNNEQQKPTKKDSNDIAQILDSLDEWERNPKTRRFYEYGPQNVWERKRKTEFDTIL